MSRGHIARLYCDDDLFHENTVRIANRQFHHLQNVLRASPGDRVMLFNGRDGEWASIVRETGSGEVTLECRERTREQIVPPDVWLCFAPLKKDRTSYAVEKATELGVSRIQPISTTRTRKTRLNLDRLRAVSIGAAQQCGGLDVPEIRPMVPLEQLLAKWPADRLLLFCDESLAGRIDNPVTAILSGPVGILVGPEGGFDPSERQQIRNHEFVGAIALGDRVLRGETAVVVALTLVNVASSFR